MKSLLLALALMGTANHAKAQEEVFDIVLHKAERIVNTPNASEFDLKVNQFKLTALNYIPTTGIRIYGSVEKSFMNTQALNLNIFLTEYFKALKNTPINDRKNCIMKFVKATRNHPLYDDKDREFTESFVKDPGGYTPFSINVNWEQAVAEIENEAKKK